VFGDVTFAQAPFASLGGNTFAVSSDETAVATAVFEVPNLVRGGIMSELSTGQDAFVSQAVMRPTQAETAVAANVQSVIATMLANASEQARATAAQSAIGTFLAAQLEASAAAATQVAIGTFLASQAETATGSEDMTRGLLISVAIAESASGAATQVSQVNFTGTIAEAVSALSTLGVIRTANVYPTGVQLFINIGGALVWAAIDDNQNPNWQNITNTQDGGWVVINDAQNPGWTNLPS
jgi:hypothetical protein